MVDNMVLENKIHEKLNSIISKDADLFTDEGLIFQGFSIPSELSLKNDCFKGWSQHFSLSEESSEINSENNNLSEIDFILLKDIFYKNISNLEISLTSVKTLFKYNLIEAGPKYLKVTNKGILVLTNYLSLQRILRNNF